MNSNEDIIRYFYEHIVSDNLLGNLEDFVSEDCTVWADGKSEKVGVNGMKEHLEAIKSQSQASILIKSSMEKS